MKLVFFLGFLLGFSIISYSESNINNILEDAKPDKNQTSNSGWRVEEISNNNIFQQLGLRNGDIITSINSKSINNPKEAMEAKSTLEKVSKASIEIIRNGKKQTLDYKKSN